MPTQLVLQMSTDRAQHAHSGLVQVHCRWGGYFFPEIGQATNHLSRIEFRCLSVVTGGNSFSRGVNDTKQYVSKEAHKGLMLEPPPHTMLRLAVVLGTSMRFTPAARPQSASLPDTARDAKCIATRDDEHAVSRPMQGPAHNALNCWKE